MVCVQAVIRNYEKIKLTARNCFESVNEAKLLHSGTVSPASNLYPTLFFHTFTLSATNCLNTIYTTSLQLALESSPPVAYIFRPHRMHEMLTILTHVRDQSRGWNRQRRVQRTPRAVRAGYSVQPLSSHFDHLFTSHFLQLYTLIDLDRCTMQYMVPCFTCFIVQMLSLHCDHIFSHIQPYSCKGNRKILYLLSCTPDTTEKT